MTLQKELNDVDDAIQELLEVKEGELNIHYKKPKETKPRKKTIDKNFRDKLKRKSYANAFRKEEEEKEKDNEPEKIEEIKEEEKIENDDKDNIEEKKRKIMKK